MQNAPAEQGRGVDCRFANDSASYSPDDADRQRSVSVDQRCDTCRHWLDYANGSNAGQCRRYAPGRTKGLWPITVSFEGCGEWQPLGSAGGTPAEVGK